MSNIVVNDFKRALFCGEFVLSAGNYSCALVTNDITTLSLNDIRIVSNWSSVSGYEATGSGYTAGGKLMTGLTVTTDNVNNKAIWDAEDVIWSSSTLTNVSGAFVKNSNNMIVFFEDFGSLRDSENGNFEVSWSPSGMLRLG